MNRDEAWKRALTKMAGWKAPGPDGIEAYWWRTFGGMGEALKEMWWQMLDGEREIPEWLIRGRTVKRAVQESRTNSGKHLVRKVKRASEPIYPQANHMPEHLLQGVHGCPHRHVVEARGGEAATPTRAESPQKGQKGLLGRPGHRCGGGRGNQAGRQGHVGGVDRLPESFRFGPAPVATQSRVQETGTEDLGVGTRQQTGEDGTQFMEPPSLWVFLRGGGMERL